MTKNKIIMGAKEALAIAAGHIPAASVYINGHTYIAKARVQELIDMLEEIINSDMAMREEDEGQVSDILERTRMLLKRHQKENTS